MSLSVPALGLASVPVDQAAWVPEVVGRKNQESLDIPDDIDRVGWDVSSARLGERHGVALISGHRDAADGGHGALEHVEDLVPGARVVVTTAAGDRLTYTVTGVEAIPNDSLPDRLFATRGPHRLALVTCGGRLVKGNDGRLHWNSNVIAWAAPA